MKKTSPSSARRAGAGKRDSFDSRPPLGPRYWPSWLAVGLIWLLGKLPQRVGLALSHPLGRLMSRLMKSRRRVAQRNIERCFPELDAKRREAILEGCFDSLGRMLFEIAWSWSASERRICRMGEIRGLEHLTEAHERGKGVLVTTAHMTCLEIGGRLMGTAMPGCSGVYRPLKNPVIEWYQNRGRSRYSRGMIQKQDMRSAIRLLRQGGIIWYAPDQDFGPRQSAFVPFFGIPTATLAATSRLPELTGCAVVMMFPEFDRETRKYVVSFYPALERFPGGDTEQDLARVNALMEEHIRSAPEQYWWIHRRFKTRPDGEPPFYD